MVVVTVQILEREKTGTAALRATGEQSVKRKRAGSSGQKCWNRWFLSGLLTGPEPRRSGASAERRSLSQVLPGGGALPRRRYGSRVPG